MQVSMLKLSALAGLAVAFAPAADVPHFAPADGSTLTKKIMSTSHLVSESVQVMLDDEEIETGGGEGAITIDDVAHIGISDEYVKSSKGRPLVLKRTYEDLGGSSTQKYKDGKDGEGKEIAKEQESVLAGKLITFKWNEKDEKYDRSSADENLDSDVLDRLDEDMDLRAFLPEADAQEDATWTIKGSAARIFLFPGGDLKLVEKDKDPKEADRSPLDHELEDTLSGKIELTYKGTREENGQNVGVIEVKGEIATKGSMESEQEGKVDIGITADLSGEIWWDMAANHVQYVEVTADEKVSYATAKEFDMEGKTRKLKQSFEFAGPAKFVLKASK